MKRPYMIEEWSKSSPWYKWAYNYGQRHLWRVSNVIGNDMADFMSEACLTYVETRNRYGATVNSPQHFMRLYQMSLSCWITDLSHKDSRIKSYLATDIQREDSISFSEPSVAPEAELSVLLDKGSNELKEVLNIFFNAPIEIMNVLRDEASSCSPKQFWNRVLAHIGIPQDRSKGLIKELNDLLS